ncbi:MAG: hypothetical protein COW00_08560 [Bdellovibrio sp. CG12_big_fil_rev_8_21_14_0_65_39_13]|nr:MAG: hypothetical protein COW78_08630 [Bdellovibrio sp. CG22_combo_CG10-13_8_21_14_all_39_27]PIQ59676.1 MAG: hypothetical protein COW00_08560 [Bdellovibrio sp. CG12_big_fil_rev_8_21_14_0_65_39_13]
MAEENAAAGGDDAPQECPKCPDCPPPGLPLWMATFSDMVTLLLTFFVLLLSMAKTETAKYEAALGSIRDAFGGNVLKQGEVIEKGKSPDDSPTMMESQEPIAPFPIEFLTTEGFLDKHEINRESDESLKEMKGDLNNYGLSDLADVYEMPEGIRVNLKDRIYFKEGSISPEDMSVEAFEKLVKLMTNEDWVVFVQGHSDRGEKSLDGNKDAFELSAARAQAVSRILIRRGIRPERITTVFYGDTRPDKVVGNVDTKTEAGRNRRVDFIIRKGDLNSDGHKVPSR